MALVRLSARAPAAPVIPVAPGGIVADKYRVERTIAFGGMGVVCEATHLELGTSVAIKFVRQEFANDERVVSRFLTEARSAAQLKSQYTCRVVDCGRLDSGCPYMVMEHLAGADLRTIIAQQGALPVGDAVSFALQICEALAEAHARHIVHRDIKPENLFLSHGPDGGALMKVLDFGISKQLNSSRASRILTQPTESIGSPYHMSPEQMIDPTQVDARTDIWSVGVVLYELLTGRLPFNGDSTPQVCANVMTATPVSPHQLRTEIPEPLANTVLQCLEKDRERRFADVGELSRALSEFAQDDLGPAAARVERILDRAIAARAKATEPSPEAHPDSSPADSAIQSRHIPGMPRKRTGLRVFALVVLVALAVVSFYPLANPLERVRKNSVPLQPAMPPKAQQDAAHGSEGAPESQSAKRVDAPPSTSAKPRRSSFSESRLDSLRPVPEPALPANSSLYPVPKPVPELPPVQPVQ